MAFRRERNTLTPVVWNRSLWRTAPPPAINRMKQHDTSDALRWQTGSLAECLHLRSAWASTVSPHLARG
jgi:hypothetical protein